MEGQALGGAVAKKTKLLANCKAISEAARDGLTPVKVRIRCCSFVSETFQFHLRFNAYRNASYQT